MFCPDNYKLVQFEWQTIQQVKDKLTTNGVPYACLMEFPTHVYALLVAAAHRLAAPDLPTTAEVPYTCLCPAGIPYAHLCPAGVPTHV